MNIEEIKKSKEIRKIILETLYNHRQDDLLRIDDFSEELKKKNLEIDERTLHGEIKYLKEKILVDTMGDFCGKEYLHFSGLKITAYGIDLVEDPEEFGKLFSINISSNSFGDINNSNISVNSNNIQQLIKNETNDELKSKLKELEKAINEKDKSRIIKTLQYIGDKSVDVLIALLINKVSNN